ncbi:phosphate ABC transporter permease PstA [Paenibacillus alginolyticus]|uniref:Phosphate transport system permease protein PstA n=1 Tax=Paenibacillus alginolyticus TaxID=59839 RepID=A0ABT4G7Q7_9BACL|nr:phosphate ABC transporter permease PstA [Paenibacillus alginolyticus]MCY9692210.1 phosphate ABC transporter permease PstA [Paenibacillus alginolyticus]MEC0145951.1 phosphate ABC transporter permease PstA [Paenibacillus alginolyticus]
MIRPSLRKRKATNVVMLCIVILFTLLALIPLVSIVSYICYKGYGAINLDFFIKLPSAVGETGGGVGNAIVGTLILVAIASIVGIPIGIFSAIYLNEYQARGVFTSSVRFVVDVLLGIPSVVVGIFAYLVFVRPIGHFSAVSGGLSLALLMIPIVTRSTEEILRLVPNSIREASYALGIPKWKTIIRIVVPYATKGIVTGVMLGIARVAGETAPLLLTAFGNHFWNKSLNEPIASLPAQIYEYAKSPYEDWIQKAWGAAMVLIVLVLALNIIARLLTKSRFKNVA